MRRSEREITDRTEIEEIIRKASICRLALSDNGTPYIVPVCFGYENDTLYFHSATEGRKLDILKRNNRVCFEMDIETKLAMAEKGCTCGMKYRSVIGFGTASVVEDQAGKQKGLDTIMRQYSGPEGDYSQEALNRTTVIKVEIESLTGKQAL